MDKNAIKKYAVWARTELIDRVRQRAVRYEVTADANPAADSASGKVLTDIEKTQRQAAIARMRDKGYEYVIEEVAYTWFNRFAALRYMEVNNYLPSRVRVFTDENGSFKPQILAEAIHLNLDGLDMEKVYALKEAENNDELYKYLLITQCNALSAVLPQMFKPVDEKCKQEKDDYTILLFPDNLLRDGSVVEQMVTLISEDNWLDAVQIIGCLYQFYNIEPKAKVNSKPKGNKIKKEEIPAATQLFTPDWIVHYMVENSLGRLWLEGHSNNELKAEWEYYLDEAQQEPEVKAQLIEIHKEYAVLKPEDILCIDPCMGSGHILAYLFDTLMKIYAAYGYSVRESVQSIIENNLYGLDIDDRASQLAYFEVMMTAAKYDNRFLKRNDVPQPHVYAIQESNNIRYEKELGDFLLSAEHRETLKYLLNVFQDAKEYGSILQIEKRDYAGFLEAWKLSAEASLENIMMMSWYMQANEVVQSLARQAQILSQKYDVTVTNPPYLSVPSADTKLNEFVAKYYPDSKSDLCSAFIEQCAYMGKKNGFYAMITMHSWMFLSSYEKLRNKMRLMDTINMAHLGARAFEEIGGEIVQTTSFVIRKSSIPMYEATYCRLVAPTSQQDKEKMYLSGENRYLAKQEAFTSINGNPIAYWASDTARAAYQYENLDSMAQPRHGLATSDNARFLRLWHEVNIMKASIFERCDKAKKWFPMSKGGSYRKWYGNLDWLINYENDGKEIKDYAISIYKCSSRTIQNTQFYFREGLTWSALASGGFSVRLQEEGALFGSGGYCAFTDSNIRNYILALMNSKATGAFIQFVSPTLNYEVGHIKTIPVVIDEKKKKAVDCLVDDNIDISRKEWDSFETSWDFQRHPLVPSQQWKQEQQSSQFVDSRMVQFGRLEWHFNNWKNYCDEHFHQLKTNEEEINRIFINIYGLQDELTPEIQDKDVTIRKAELQRDIKSLISYAVGCMFGRYSLDKDGLAYAGGEWNAAQYKTFPADKDNIIPLCDDEYFEDDITGLFVKFIETVYGKDTLDENLRFIADALGGKGTPKEVIRNYFLNDFFADHCKMYQKRPIYWLFDSGKKNGFKALVYMHRYQPDTIARMRTDYVHEQQSRYRTAISDLENRIAGASTSERVRLTKQLSKLQDQSAEIHTYEEKIHHLADRMIAIDLDDGVKHNYEIFKDVLAKIK